MDVGLGDGDDLGVIAVSLSIVTLIYAPIAATSLPAHAPRATVLLAVLGLADPVVAVMLRAVFLDELITVSTVIGFALVIAGCWLATRPPPVGSICRWARGVISVGGIAPEMDH